VRDISTYSFNIVPLGSHCRKVALFNIIVLHVSARWTHVFKT